MSFWFGPRLWGRSWADLVTQGVERYSQGKTCPAERASGTSLVLWKDSRAEAGAARSTRPFFQLVAGGLCDPVHGEAEFHEQVLERGRGAEGSHADARAVVAHELGPAEGRGLLDGHAGLDVGRQNVVAVSRILIVEELPAGHAHDAGLDTFLRELLVGAHAQ